MRKLRKLLSWLLLLGLISCGNEKQVNDRLNDIKVDTVSKPLKPVKISRLEQELFGSPIDQLEATSKKLELQYGDFYKQFASNIINPPKGLSDPEYIQKLKLFISDKYMREAYTECEKQYNNMDFLASQLQVAFARYETIFPGKKIPRIVTFMSGFNYSVAFSDSTIGIGIEMHLGENHQFYNNMSEIFPVYRRKNMNKESMFVNVLKALLNAEFDSLRMNKNDLLSQMVLSGKMLYLIDALAPETNDTLKITYSDQQLNYCVTNEANMWQYFIKKKMLYSTDANENMKFLSEGPFTSAFGKQSPPRIGQWIGWQIIRKYMDNNPKISIPEMLKQDDAQTILSMAKYKPIEKT